MFRRFQNPIVQGTQVMPNAMQAPPVVRVRGLQDGSPEAIAVLQRVAPIVQGFVRSQRQSQEIAGLNHVRIRRDFPDLRVTYDRLFGREVIEVEVKPEIIRAVIREPAEPQIIYDTMLDGVITLSANDRTEYNTAVFTTKLNGAPLSTMTIVGSGVAGQRISAVEVHGFGPRAFDLPRDYVDGQTYPLLDGVYGEVTPTPFSPAPPRNLLTTSLERLSLGDYSQPQGGDGPNLTIQRSVVEHRDYAPLKLNGQNELDITFNSDLFPEGQYDSALISVNFEFYARSTNAYRLAERGWSRQKDKPTDLLYANVAVVRANEIVSPSNAGSVYIRFTLDPNPDDVYTYTHPDNGFTYLMGTLSTTVEDEV